MASPSSSLSRAVLALSDGSVFVGNSLGAPSHADSPVLGELVFNTSMTGYQEALTDPSYAGQMLCFSYPLIGNYGISSSAVESTRVHARACIVHQSCSHPLHVSGTQSLHQYLFDAGVSGMWGVDTRSIVQRIRRQGVMPAALAHVGADDSLEEISSSLASAAKGFDYEAVNYVSEVSTSEEVWLGGEYAKHVVLLDCGAKQSISHQLLLRGVGVRILPSTASAQDIRSSDPAGMMISNGPGDPSKLGHVIDTVAQIVADANRPIFGICLGHQILAHALGATTYKLKFGHRGSNHPVQDMETSRVHITAQNHGYAVKDIPERIARPWLRNCYDGSNEGLRHNDLPILSVQYHPEANPGPYDSQYLFDEFVKML